MKSSLINRLSVEERPGKTCFRFWQEGPRLRSKLDDTFRDRTSHPVHSPEPRRGLVDRAVAWKWSSASWYLLEPGRQQLLGLPFIDGLPVGVLDQS
jgi:REP-associated tyrosine transposase